MYDYGGVVPAQRMLHRKPVSSGVPTPARRCAYAVVRRVLEQDAWADRALHAEAERLGLDRRERALATQLVYGTVQRLATLDHVIEALAKRPMARLDPPVRAALRIGAFQLAFLDRVPAHAAVGESVELVKADARHAAPLVNAVLRRAAREARDRIAALPDGTPQEAALRRSHPAWIAELWWEALGPDAARALMDAGNRPAEPALRANALKTTREELLDRLPVEAHAAPDLPDAVILDAPFDAHGSPLHRDGLFMPQSRAAQAVARVLDPRPGERVLDLCAAPGGKTTHLAALMRDEGEIVAVERHAGRARELRDTAARMGATCVSVRTGDATDDHGDRTFHRVLVDPPCSDLGTLAARPDARWRKPADAPARLAEEQVAILRAGAEAVKPGGTLVYSTCTISPRENEGLIEGFLAESPDFAPEDLRSDLPVWEHPAVAEFLLTLPHRDGTDGFFVARLRKKGGEP